MAEAKPILLHEDVRHTRGRSPTAPTPSWAGLVTHKNTPPARCRRGILAAKGKNKGKPFFEHEKTPETQVFREFWLEVTPGFESLQGNFASC